MRSWKFAVLSVTMLLLLALPGGSVFAETGTAFTYQGHLTQSSSAVDQTCGFQFSLYDALSSGSQVGSTLTKSSVSVSSGLFSVSLDFGTSAFAGAKRWLASAVRCPDSGSYTSLSPRQELTPTPYSLYSRGNWSVLGDSGTTAGTNFIGTTDAKDFVIKTNDAERLRIMSDGNLAIGQNTANSRLHVQPVTGAAIQIDPFGASAGNTGELRLLELVAGGTNFVGFKAPDAIASNEVWTLPNADGSSGQVLRTDGSNVLTWVTQGGFSTATLTATGTLTASTEYHTSTTSSAFAVTLPSAPADGAEIRIIDVKGDFDTNNLTVNRGGSDTIEGGTSLTLSTENGVFALHYDADTNRWSVARNDSPAPITLHQARMRRNSAQTLTISGGDTKILLDTQDYDVGGIADPSGANKFTIKQAGRYLMNASICINNTQNMQVSIRVNGSIILQNFIKDSAAKTDLCPTISIVRDLSAGNTVELYAARVLGDASVDTLTPEEQQPYLEVIQLATSVTTNVAQAAEYLYAQTQTNQTSNLASGDHVKFDTVVTSSGSSVTLDTTTAYTTTGSNASVGRFTLQSGKTYRLSAAIPWTNGSILRLQWYDTTKSANISQWLNVETSAANSGNAGAIFTATVETVAELRVNSNTGVTAIGADSTFLYPWAIIEVIADGTAVSQFTAATASAAGTIGFIPAPASGDQGALLLGNSDWTDPATELFVDTSNNRVGIGVATPLEKLHIAASATGIGLRIDAGSNANEGGQITLMDKNGTGGWEIDVEGGAGSERLRFFRDRGENNTSTTVFISNDSNINAAAFNVTSDRRLKTNIQSYEGGLDAILDLQGVTYNRLRDGIPIPGLEVGLIAQDVGMVIPEVVSTGPDGYMSISYGQLVPVLIEAIKELNDHNSALKQLVCLDHPGAEVCQAIGAQDAGNTQATPERGSSVPTWIIAAVAGTIAGLGLALLAAYRRPRRPASAGQPG